MIKRSSIIPRRRFTLLEVLVSMTILMLLLSMLYTFFLASRDIWSRSMSKARIYRNSRIAFSLIQQDIQSCLTSTTPGREISFYIGDPDPTDKDNCLYTCFISTADPQTAANTRISEISYKFHTDGTDGTKRYFIRRQIVSDDDTTNWNFYGQPPNWFTNTETTDAFEDVIGGVTSFNMTFYGVDNNAITAGSDTVVVPNRIVVTMELFDEKLIDAPSEKKFETQRTFSKVFFIYAAGLAE